jgi:hypothetical protein
MQRVILSENSVSFSSNSIARYLDEIIFVKALFPSIFIFDWIAAIEFSISIP